jgi:hypothetical protein
MLRFALHRQGQDCQVCTRGRANACRGSLRFLQLKEHKRFGYRRPQLNLRASIHRRKGFLPALNYRVSTLRVGR